MKNQAVNEQAVKKEAPVQATKKLAAPATKPAKKTK